MKHCPECNKNYADPTVSFCLNDGTPLLFDAAVTDAEPTLLSGDPPSESPTRHIDPHTTAPTESLHLSDPPHAKTRSRSKWIWILGGIAVIAALAGLTAYRFYRATSSNQIESVAVLPFENGSGSADMDYLSDELPAEVIYKLTPISQLKVIARTSSFKYRDPNPDIKDIAAKLGVQAIVMGKVAKIGDRLSVQVELVDATSNKQIWGERFNRPFDQLINTQQEIAETISDKLRVKLTGAQETQLAKRGTDNPQAYELYLKAINLRTRQKGTDSRVQVNQLLQQAVATDSRYALAWVALASNYLALAGSGYMDPKEAFPKSDAALQKALDLDPDIPEAHRVKAGALENNWQWQAAEEEYRRAIELDPGDSQTRGQYSNFLSVIGRHDEAVAEAAKSVERDPISIVANNDFAYALHFAKRYEESIAAANRVLELEPESNFAHLIIGYDYLGLRNYQDALNDLKKAVELGDNSPSTKVYLGAAYVGVGQRDKAWELLKELKSGKVYASPGELPVLLVALGDYEAAFASFEKAYDQHDLQLKYLNVEIAFDPIRDDARFRELVRKVGLPVQN